MYVYVYIYIYKNVYAFCMTQLNDLIAISVSRCVFLIPLLTFNNCTNQVWIILHFIQLK